MGFSKFSLFYFWLAVWYLIILFHSFGIPEIWNKIKGVDILFISGVLGYFLTLLTRIVIFPVLSLIKKIFETLASNLKDLPLVDLPNVPGSGPGNDIINIVCISLFMLAFSILLFTGAIFFILWILRRAFDPQDIIFKRFRRFREINKVELNRVIPIYIPRFLIFGTFVILILFEGIIGSFQNIYKLTLSFSSIFDYIYYIVFIAVGLFMIKFFLIIINDDGKKIFTFISAITGKTSQFHENFVKSIQSNNANIYLKNLFDKKRNLFLIILFSIVPVLRDYQYGRSSMIEIRLYFLIYIFAIIYIFWKFRKKKII